MQEDERIAVRPDVEVEDGAADADGRGRRLDLVALAGIAAREEPQCSLEKPNGDRLRVAAAADGELVEPQFRVRAERQLGVVVEAQLRLRFRSGAHEFVAEDAKALLELPLLEFEDRR